MWDISLAQDQLNLLELERYPIELLVLSSCNTAVGNQSNYDGGQTKFGLAGRAIQLGVKSVIASSWLISDQGTAVLMQEFYRQLNTASTKSEAFRQAQIAMLKNRSEFSHPYYWAGFTVIGNPW
jgi:CHAT domain-containing protein